MEFLEIFFKWYLIYRKEVLRRGTNVNSPKPICPDKDAPLVTSIPILLLHSISMSNKINLDIFKKLFS